MYSSMPPLLRREPPSSAKDAAPAHDSKPERLQITSAKIREGALLSTSAGDENIPDPICMLTNIAEACVQDNDAGGNPVSLKLSGLSSMLSDRLPSQFSRI